VDKFSAHITKKVEPLTKKVEPRWTPRPEGLGCGITKSFGLRERRYKLGASQRLFEPLAQGFAPGRRPFHFLGFMSQVLHSVIVIPFYFGAIDV
jgi:hypothetical protein